MADSTVHQIPPLVDLGLIDLEVKKVTKDPTYRVSELIGMGSQSLGGARPKATVRDKSGHLWVAKFAAINDDPRFESTIMNAASALGIHCAETKHVSVASSGVVLSKRFDRQVTTAGTVERIGMRSYAAVLEIQYSGTDVDWADIASASHPDDHEEIWRRTAFGVLVGNTDDHVRNHSQLRTHANTGWQWRLSPAYDITSTTTEPADHALSLLVGYAPKEIAANLDEFAHMLKLESTQLKAWIRHCLSYLANCSIPLVASAQEVLHLWAQQ